MNDFTDRVHHLSPAARRRLAERLAELAPEPPADPGDHQLVAYLVTRSGEPLPAADLKAFLRARLPEALVPAALVTLPALPRTASGKVDRRALPEPAAPQRSAPGVPHRLAELWEDLLGLSSVGEEDDFFALGGDSILVLKLCARARDLGLALSPRMVYEQPTLGALGDVLAAGTAGR